MRCILLVFSLFGLALPCAGQEPNPPQSALAAAKARASLERAKAQIRSQAVPPLLSPAVQAESRSLLERAKGRASESKDPAEPAADTFVRPEILPLPHALPAGLIDWNVALDAVELLTLYEPGEGRGGGCADGNCVAVSVPVAANCGSSCECEKCPNSKGKTVILKPPAVVAPPTAQMASAPVQAVSQLVITGYRNVTYREGLFGLRRRTVQEPVYEYAAAGGEYAAAPATFPTSAASPCASGNCRAR